MMITILAGAALSISGAIVQSVTKNPIAEPGILGINAGGGFAITLFIAIGKINAHNFVYVLPLNRYEWYHHCIDYFYFQF